MANTTWSDYARDNSYTDREAEQKLAFVSRCIERLQPRTVWDLGCNTGEYAVAALRAGAGSVIGFDSDMGALEQAFQRARRDKLDFLPLHMDVANPSPDQGWDQSERSGLAARAKPEAVVALALVHHLALAGNVPLDYVVRWIVQRAPAGIVEFIPVDDPMVQSMLALRDVVPEGYQEANFLDSLRAGASIIATERMAESGRLLVCYGPSLS
jgi:ribosomal protein L11 methylase PrmA